jgi:hypothetical protein
VQVQEAEHGMQILAARLQWLELEGNQPQFSP